MNYDIIIIGGGLLGTATAYQLAKRKAGKILLLDGNEIASQASSRAACLLTISDSFGSPEITTAEQRQTSFTAMMKVALGVDAFLEK